MLHYWAMDVSARGLMGEAHFAWVLEGRAVQDVWIMPRASERTGQLDKSMNMYGTTLRVWDPALKAWRISWSNPAGDHYEQQIGRRSGKDVVQIGTRADGTPTRWRFTAITPDSFHWLGESLHPRGDLEAGGRVPGPAAPVAKRPHGCRRGAPHRWQRRRRSRPHRAPGLRRPSHSPGWAEGASTAELWAEGPSTGELRT